MSTQEAEWEMMVTRDLDYDKIDVNNLYVIEHIKDTLKESIFLDPAKIWVVFLK